ncbi:MAG: hypothetical protein P8I93_05535 [Crocinitomicaceae bacterium]|nr:hypothetical protein [Crocinitomicaceae bacterium]
MNKTYIFLFFLFFFISNFSISCCAENNYRLFPIGELDKNVIFIEFKFHRNCSNAGMGKNNTFRISGRINLVSKSIDSDSTTFIQNIDSLQKVVECQCIYNNQYKNSKYDSIMEGYYLKALKIAKEKKGFKIGKTVSLIFNDTLNTKITQNDTFHLLKYKNLLNIDLDSLGYSSSIPENVIETRTYKTQNYKVIVIRISASLLSKKAIKHNKKRFKKIKTAFWKEKATWHGMVMDFAFLKPN